MLTTIVLCLMVDGILFVAYAVSEVKKMLRLSRYNNGVRNMEPPCHVVGCKRRVTHSHWPHDDPCDVQYFCPKHTGEHMERGRSYTVEPWITELSDKAIHSILHSEYHWKQAQNQKCFLTNGVGTNGILARLASLLCLRS